jgi:hypothetical protein
MSGPMQSTYSAPQSMVDQTPRYDRKTKRKKRKKKMK